MTTRTRTLAAAEAILLTLTRDGRMAAARSIGIFDSGHLDSRILVLHEGYDPDSYVFKFGVEAFIKMAEKAVAPVDFLLESAVQKHGLRIEGKVRIISDMKGHLAEIQDRVARALYIKKIAEVLDIDDQAIMEEVRKKIEKKLSAEQSGRKQSLEDWLNSLKKDVEFLRY